MARVKLAGTTGASENTIVFSPAGGHSHNGRNSSLIDSTAYSMYDFSPTFVGTEINPERAVRQENNRIALEDTIKRVVNNSVLAPAGIRLEAGSLNGSLIIANTITANQLAANTITADEIAAGTITATQLSSNIILVNNVISSNNYNSNAKTGWTILSNGYSEFRSGIISNWNFNNTSITSTVIDANNYTHSISLATSGINLNTDVYNWSNTPIISMISTASNSSPNGSTYHAPGASFYFASDTADMNAATYIRPYAIHLRDGLINETDNRYYGGYIDEGMVTMSLQTYASDGGGVAHSSSVGSGGGGGSSTTTTYDTDKALRLALIKKTGDNWVGNNAPIQNYLNLTKTYTHVGRKIVSPEGALMGPVEFISNAVSASTYVDGDYVLIYKANKTIARVAASSFAVSSAGSASYVPASGITGQSGMWTSANRPGPYRLYRRDADNDYSVQTYWTGSRWRLYGYQGDTGHADTHVGYADSAGSAPNPNNQALNTDSDVTHSRLHLTADSPGITIDPLQLSRLNSSSTTVGLVLRSDGYVCTNTSSSVSKREFKNNIAEIQNCLDTVNKLTPRNFTFKDELVNLNRYEDIFNLQIQKQYGFIVDEVESVNSELIDYDYENGELVGQMWKSNAIIALSVGAIKELLEKVNRLEARIIELEGV